jgi:hypothetical protein
MPSPLPRRNRWIPVIGQHFASFAIRRRRPSPLRRWVGFRIYCFGASMAFHLCSGLQTRGAAKQPFPSGASAGWLSAAVPIATGCNDYFPGGTFTRWTPSPFARRTTQLDFRGGMNGVESRRGAVARIALFPRPAHRTPTRGSLCPPASSSPVWHESANLRDVKSHKPLQQEHLPTKSQVYDTKIMTNDDK